MDYSQNATTNTICNSIDEVIGNTPLLALDRLTQGIGGRILAKLEYLNPGFSKKDRAALEIISEAETNGTLNPGQTVIELTSGNMGTGLAIVCAARGYPFVAVMSKGNSVERIRMMRALGAEVILVDQAPDSIPGQVSGEDLALVDDVATRIAAERRAFRADQFNHPGNPAGHYSHTAAEIWAQSYGGVTGFCDFVGSGGTFAGVSRYLKEKDPDIACYIVEPAGASVLAGDAPTAPNHPIQGGGYAMRNLSFLDDTLVDGHVAVTASDAIDTTRRLAREEGVFAGFSSGANVAAALQLLSGQLKGGTIAVAICDSGLKYLSTDLWE